MSHLYRFLTIMILASTLFLAACAGTATQPPTAAPVRAAPPVVTNGLGPSATPEGMSAEPAATVEAATPMP